ncbi:MAG: hypothetical protein J6X02_00220 [Bacilli bacterium]|nr:hypothetical protein [Bacilli bacterium]
MKKNEVLIPIIVVVVGLLCFGLSFVFKEKVNEVEKPGEKPSEKEEVLNYNTNLIKGVHTDYKGSNYLVSPYSIEIALNLLREGTNNSTLEELNKALPNREFKDLNSANVKISNATFINKQYESKVLKTFTDNMKNKYHAEEIIDQITPKLINDWANEKTDGMIKEVVDRIDDNFVYGVINAVALDLKFKYQFECINTTETDFNKIDGSTMKVPMMHQTYEGNIKYVTNDEYQSVSLPYVSEGEYNYEIVGILPKDIDSFINGLTDEKLNNIMKDSKVASSDTNLALALPQFSYEYKLEDNEFAKVLNILGIKEVFNKEKADFSRFMSKEDIEKIGNIYVSKAVHKTFIDLNEQGTRAAAVTYFGMDKNEMIIEQPKIVSITFDKPFVYMIRETGTKEILFFGIVYEPKTWTGPTCQ